MRVGVSHRGRIVNLKMRESTMSSAPHTVIAIHQIDGLQAYTKSLKPVIIDGQSLEIAAVVAVSK